MEEKPEEIKQVSEREIWIGEHRLYLGEDNILYITTVGEIDEELAVDFIKSIHAFDKFSGGAGRRSVLVDLNKAGKASSRARKIFKESIDEEGTGKVAYFGTHPVARVIASFIMGVTKKKDIRFFKTKEDALAWLKE